MAKKTILVVDDEQSIRDMLTLALELNGYDCLLAENASEANDLIVNKRPDLVLLDWMMPGISGIELARRLRRDSNTKSIPVIMITAKSAQSNKIDGLETGVDDYVTKPFSTMELLARIKTVLRRSQQGDHEHTLFYKGLVLDPLAHRVSANGNAINLGPTEYRLLHFFMSHPERVFSREQLLDNVWGADVYIDNRTVDVHIRRLRKALSAYRLDQLIQTVRGAGYRFSKELN